MADVRIPELMPRGLPDRQTTARSPIHVLQPVRGLEMGQIEAAIAHLAAHRLLPVPGSARQVSIATSPSYTTCRIRIAQPMVCQYAWVQARLRFSGVYGVTGTFRVNSDYQATYTSADYEASADDSLAFPVSLIAEIGGRSLTAHAGYQTVNVQVNYSGGGTGLLEELLVTPLPIARPQSTPTVTT